MKHLVKNSHRTGLLWTPLLIAALVFLPGCQTEDPDPYELPLEDGTTLHERETIMQVAVDSQTEDAEAALEEESIWCYDIIAEEYLTPDSPEAEEGKYNVQLILEIGLGPTYGRGAMTPVLRRSMVELDQKTGTYTENTDSIWYSWAWLTTISDLNHFASEHNYQARIEKDDAAGKSLTEITMLLAGDFMDSFRTWGDNSFCITEYELQDVELFEPEASEITGNNPEKYTYPGSMQTWDVNLYSRRVKLIGVCNGVNDFGGTVFGNDGVWQSEHKDLTDRTYNAFTDALCGLVLTEWDDSYTLATKYYCKKELGYVE